MKRRVIISKLPQAQSGLETKMRNLRAGLGFNANTMPWPVMAGKLSAPDIEVNETLQPVAREDANLEAEKDEIAVVPEADKSGIPSTYKIGGKRHYQGGTPLNLPNDSFIFSDTARMRIKDPVMLAQFGMPFKKGGYTPAEIAKKYNVNPYKKILADPDADQRQKDTAELMISNYNLKLAKLALLQESMKGFPQGIPAIAMPYIQQMQINPEEFLQMTPGAGEDQSATADNMAYGGMLTAKDGLTKKAQAKKPLPPGYVSPAHEVPGRTMPFVKNTGLGFDPSERYDYPQLTEATGSYRPVYDMYLEAQNTNDIPTIHRIINEIERKKDELPWYSWDMAYNSYKDKYSDFAAHLYERVERIKKRDAEREVRNTKEKQAAEYNKKIDAAADRLNKKLQAATTSVEKSQIDSELKQLNKLRPQNRTVISGSGPFEQIAYMPGTIAPAITAGVNYIIQGAANKLANTFSDKTIVQSDNPYGYSEKDIELLNKLAEVKDEETSTTPTEPVSTTTPTTTTAADTSGVKIQTPKTEVKKTTLPTETTKSDATRQKQPAPKAPKRNPNIPESVWKIMEQNRLAKEGSKKYGGEAGVRKVRIKSLGTYAEGGLVKAKHGIAGIPEKGETYNGKNVSGTYLDPASGDVIVNYSDGTAEQIPNSASLVQQAKKKFAESSASAALGQKEYDELVAAYKKAEAAYKRNPKEKHAEVEAFQKLYHQYLPDVARNIIAQEDPTTHAKNQSFIPFDTEGNEDALFGKRTKKYFEALEKLKPAEAKEEAKPGKTTVEGKTTTSGDTGTAYDPTLYAGSLNVPRQGVRPFIPVQNMLDIGRSFQRLLTQKTRMPWEAKATIPTPKVAYYDPRGEIDAQRAAMATLANATGAFSGAQAQRAALSQMAGQGFRGAADTLGRYNNMNVGVANQYFSKLADAETKQSLLDADRATRLYDKTNVALEARDRQKNINRDLLVNSINAGLTAGAHIYNLNTLYPQYAVNPFGMVYGHDFKPVKPTYKTPQDYAQMYDDLLNNHPYLQQKPEVALEILKKSLGDNTPTNYEAYTQYKGNRGVTPYYPGAPEGYVTHPSQYYENS